MDETYIHDVLNGDTEAFRYLVNKYKKRAYNLARSIVRSDLIAEEATQDAFVQAFRNLRGFKGKASFSTWFYRIVVNESLKKNKKKKFQNIALNEGVLGEKIPDIQSNIIEQIHEEEQRELIAQVLENLKENEALLLKLYYLEEKRIDEIVEITGLTLSNCKVILYRARKNFAENYNQKVNH